MCHETGQLTLLSTHVSVPHFGDALESTLCCGACGFRHADFMILGQKEPVRLTFHAKDERALHVRVIRSNSGTVRIPEIGFTAEPSQISESYVSNVEGVLERAKDILLTALDWNKDDPQKVGLLGHYLQTWERMVRAELPFTLIIDDPFGNSAIVSENIEKRPLSEEEIVHLRTGMTVVDLTETGE
jgi:zinc finger protein